VTPLHVRLAVAGAEDSAPRALGHTRLGAAERTGVAVARALLDAEDVKAHVLVLDEPTATLPDGEVDRLLSTLRSVAASGVAIIYVTHHLQEVAEFAHRVSVLRDGRLISTMPISGLDRRRLVHDMIGAQLEAVERLERSERRPRSASPILTVENVHGGALKGLGFDAWAGEIVGLCGLTGSGREAALGAIFGARPRDEGRVRVAGEVLAPGRPDNAIRAGLAYLSDDRRTGGCVMDMSARDNLTLANLAPFWRKLNLGSKEQTAEARSWFESLDVRPRDGVELPMSSLSGGNQQKVLFAKWLRLAPRVLLLDEPTQGVDVGAKAELHRQLLAAKATGAAVVISSTDLDELATLCDGVLFIRGGAVAREMEGAAVTPVSLSRSFHMGATTSETGAQPECM
jgi:ribose transport system ATP-binding protein